MLTERLDQGLVSDVVLVRARRVAQVIVVIAATVLIVTGFVAAPAQPNIIRIALAPFSSMKLGALPADVAGESVPDRALQGAVGARRLNALIPFAPGAGVAARPFLSPGGTADRDRAIDCLAIAAMSEAGGSDDGQRAVIQVILNRVRHPAFAKTICGVVFEGAHRSTGCQFTFTCDGALARRHSPSAWSRARARAIEALEGRVYAPVSLATHYHTDWVHPYWSASLIKIARVDTHLFFRWPGYWGSPASLNTSYRGGEPVIAQLAYLSAHADGAPGVPPHDFGAGDQAGPSSSSIDVLVRNADGGAFVLFTGMPSAAGARETGRSVCADRPSCKVFGWFERASIPAGYPVPTGLRAKLGFSYFRSSGSDEIVLYDCSRFSNIAVDNCLPPPARGRPKQQADPELAAVALNSRPVTPPNASTKIAGASLQP